MERSERSCLKARQTPGGRIFGVAGRTKHKEVFTCELSRDYSRTHETLFECTAATLSGSDRNGSTNLDTRLFEKHTRDDPRLTWTENGASLTCIESCRSNHYRLR